MPTARLDLPYPAGTQAADGPAQIKALADALDSTTPYAQGTFAARPAASPAGKLYYSTDTGLLSYANGAAWIDIGPSIISDLGITTLKLANSSVDASKIGADQVGSSEIAAGAVGNSELASGAVDAGKIASSLKPSGSAIGTTEALRALGTATGRAAAGLHAAQHNVGGSDIVDWADGLAKAHMPGAYVQTQSNKNIQAGNNTNLQFYDNDSGDPANHGPSYFVGGSGWKVSGSAVSVPKVGWYLCTAGIAWEANANGLREMWFDENHDPDGAGTQDFAMVQREPGSSSEHFMTIQGLWYFTDPATQGVRLWVRQSSGTTLTIPNYTSSGWMSVVWLGP